MNYTLNTHEIHIKYPRNTHGMHIKIRMKYKLKYTGNIQEIYMKSTKTLMEYILK